jgi:ATP-dependent DNA helicase RecQ
MTISKAREILKHQFGYDSFRMNQEAAIGAVLGGRDCVVLMPTGGGKSLCYQIPALMQDGLTLVVSPLIALMKDQVDALRANGVEAAFLNSTQTAVEQVEVFRSVRSGRLKLLYVAPERLPGRRPVSGFYPQYEHFALRDRRGPLHFKLGSRFQAGVFEALVSETGVSADTRHCSYRDRR